MKVDNIEKVVNQISRYNLDDYFLESGSLKKWIFSLNKNQLNNFLNIDIDCKYINDFNYLIVDKNFLSSDFFKFNLDLIKLIYEKYNETVYYDDLMSDVCLMMMNEDFLKSDDYVNDIVYISKISNQNERCKFIGFVKAKVDNNYGRNEVKRKIF